MAGSLVNQDGSLGYAYTMSGAEDVGYCIKPLYLTHFFLVTNSFLWTAIVLATMPLLDILKPTYSKYSP